MWQGRTSYYENAKLFFCARAGVISFKHNSTIVLKTRKSNRGERLVLSTNDKAGFIQKFNPLHIFLFKSRSGRKTLYYHTVSLWNSLDNSKDDVNYGLIYSLLSPQVSLSFYIIFIFDYLIISV